MSGMYIISPYVTLGQTPENSSDKSRTSPGAPPATRPDAPIISTESVETFNRRLDMKKTERWADFLSKQNDSFYNGQASIELLGCLIPYKEYHQIAEKICDTLLGNKPETFSPIPEELAKLGLTDSVLKRIAPAKDIFIINSAQIKKTDILFGLKDARSTEAAISILSKVISGKDNNEYCRADAAVKLAKALMSDKANTMLAEAIVNKLTGKTNDAITADMIPDRLKAIGITAEALNTISALKKTKDNEYLLLETNLLKARILTEKEGRDIALEQEEIAQAKSIYSEVLSKDHNYMSLKQVAAIGLGNILLGEAKTTPQALEVFAALRDGKSLTIGGKAIQMTAVSKENPYNYDSVQLGYNKAALSLPADNKVQVKTLAETEFRRIAASETDTFLKESASLELASLLKNNKATRDEATELFNGLQKSETPFIRKRAVIELCIIALETKESGEENKAAAEANLRAALNDPSLKGFLRNQVALALANRLAENKETATEAISLYDSVITATTDPYLIASARIGRANILSGSDDKTQKAAAQRDYLDALITIKAADGKVPVEYRRLEIQANKGLTNVAGAGAEGTTIEGIRVQTWEEMMKAYNDALEAKEIEIDPYLEATISLQRLQSMLNECDPKTPAGSILSGQIISGYKTFLRGDYPPEMRNRAILGLATAFQKFGNAEEAKKYLEIIENAPDFEKERFVDAASLQNMGVLSIGDSDPKLALKYFEAADRRDPSDPSTKIYSARAMYLTERFNTKEFMEKYNEALDLLWAQERKDNIKTDRNMPPLEDLVKEIFDERGENFETLNSTANGRYIILTSLEAEAKRWQSKGDDFKAALRYEKAVALLEAWQGTGQAPKNDYLFESQLHYDLASAYLGLNRMYDAYKEYQQIKDLGVAPGWWIEDQLRLLNPEQLSVSVTGEEDLNIAYRRAFEKGNIQLSVSKDGGSAEGFFFVNENKSLGVRVRLGAFKHGRYDAGLGLEYNKGKYKVWANANYSRSETNEGIEKQVIGIEAGAETRLTRYLTIGMKGNVDFHYEDFDYTTWELTAYARYARKLDLLGKNATFFANIEATYGKKRLEAYTYGEEPVTQASEGTESGWWEWDTTDGVQHSYTINTATRKPLRERFWYLDNGDGGLTDDSGNPRTGWHISVALEPETQIKNIANPLSSTPGDTIEIKLNDIYKMSFMSDENSWLSAENSLVLPKGQRPSASQINGMNLDAMIQNPNKPKLCVHQEKIKTQTTVPSQSGGEFSITVEGRDRAYVKDQWNTEFGGWYDLYTIKVTKTSIMGVPTTTVSMTDHVTGETSTLYQGKQTKEAILVIEDFFRARVEVGVTKKVHLKGMDAVLEVTPSLFAGGEHVDKPKLKDNEWANTQEEYYYGANLAARLSKGADTLSGNLTLANYNGEGWDTTWSLAHTHAIGADASIRAEINPGGLQGGIGYKGVYAGIDSNGMPTAGIKVPAIRANGQQYFGEIPLGISADGVSAYGISAAAASPIGVAAGSVAKAYDANQDVKKTREEIEVITRQLKEADDPKLRALLRQKLADAYIKAGASTANWLQDSTRIPVLNVLTMLGGTREYKNSVRIEDEIKGTLESLSALEENGAFAWMAGKDDSIPASADAIRSYIGEEAEYFEESNGSVRKIADAQEKVVRGVLTPVRLAAKALHITNPKPEAGTVTKRSFSGMVDNKRQLWADLLSQGYIDGEGVIQQKTRDMADDEVVALDTEMYSLSERHKITTALRESLDREDRPVEERLAPPTGTAEEIRKAFNQKLFEDSMYLIYRLISQKGMTPQTRTAIGQMLSKLPDNMRSEVEHFIDAMPVEYLDELNSGIKVTVNPSSTTEEAARPEEKPEKVLIEAEVFSRESLKGNALSDRLALEKAAVERFESTKNTEQLSEELLAELQDAIKTQDSNAIYSSAVGLFMIAGTSDNNAGMISEKIRTLTPEELKELFGALDPIKDKIVDFYTNRRPGSKKVFGGQKTKVKVEGFWGERSSNGQPKAIKAEFSVEEFVSAVITGRVREETINKNSRAVAKKDFKGMVGDVDALWTALVIRGYINQNGVIQQSFRTLQETEDRSKALEDFDMPYEQDVKENIFSVLANYKTSSKPGFVRDTSVRDIKHRSRADESTRAALNITPAPAVQETADAEEEQPSPAKIDERRPVVEMSEQDNKEAEKAAKAERIRKAQERYGVGSHRSRRR